MKILNEVLSLEKFHVIDLYNHNKDSFILAYNYFFDKNKKYIYKKIDKQNELLEDNIPQFNKYSILQIFSKTSNDYKLYYKSEYKKELDVELKKRKELKNRNQESFNKMYDLFYKRNNDASKRMFLNHSFLSIEDKIKTEKTILSLTNYDFERYILIKDLNVKNLIKNLF